MYRGLDVALITAPSLVPVLRKGFQDGAALNPMLRMAAQPLRSQWSPIGHPAEVLAESSVTLDPVKQTGYVVVEDRDVETVVSAADGQDGAEAVHQNVIGPVDQGSAPE